MSAVARKTSVGVDAGGNSVERMRVETKERANDLRPRAGPFEWPASTLMRLDADAPSADRRLDDSQPQPTTAVLILSPTSKQIHTPLGPCSDFANNPIIHSLHASSGAPN